MVQVKPMKFWRFRKRTESDTSEFVLFEHQLPEEVRNLIITVLNEAGYGVTEHTHYPPSR